MRYGFTTGSCAAAAAKAACYMLLTGRDKTEITIETPKKILFPATILDRRREKDAVSCAVMKDGGDDPDVTSGALIYARVSYVTNQKEKPVFESPASERIYIEGGFGVGRVTKPGLDQPVGNAAINHVPREMITKEVAEVMELCDYKGSLEVLISVPQGEEIAMKTFNPRLGIVGGISILGTSGIVEPMSSQALLDTIRVELRQKRALGEAIVAITPGNYGQDFMKNTYGYDLEQSVKCSNFIGETLDMAVELGFEKVVLTGHIGKLIKVSGGIMNTHSKEADCRMELLVTACLHVGTGVEELLKKIMACLSTEEALAFIKDWGLLEATMERVMEQIMFYLHKRAGSRLQVECILYSNEYGELARSAGAQAMMKELMNELMNEE